MKLNKVHKFNIKNYKFGDLPRESIISLFRDGRICSYFLERQLEKWFPDLKFVNGHGYDFVSTKTKLKYDAKNFTKGGLRFMPSNQIGAGRQFNLGICGKHVEETIYILCDIVDFPRVRVVAKSGKELLKQYSKCVIPLRDREKVFA